MTQDNALIEKAARAIADKLRLDPDTLVTKMVPHSITPEGFRIKDPDSHFWPIWTYYIPHAQAVLDTMTEPYMETLLKVRAINQAGEK